ncbi:cold-shock protein [Paenibacillus sp. MB22_1]|uniref:cold-shock protein n=1 Tax=Paenibacillus sp. MB22_1 TaxID=3383121 RepID=UPI00399F81CA
MLYPVAKTWDGLNGEEMAEVFSRIGPSLGKSPVAPPKEKRKKADTSRKRGVVKFINAQEGYGFISIFGADDLHFSVPGGVKLMRGDHVTFEVGEDARGRLTAKDVRLAR